MHAETDGTSHIIDVHLFNQVRRRQVLARVRNVLIIKLSAKDQLDSSLHIPAGSSKRSDVLLRVPQTLASQLLFRACHEEAKRLTIPFS
jgi:hypothetical protein